MKELKELSNYLDKISKSSINNLVKVQKRTAESICRDAKEFAPIDTGEYRNSIKVKETEVTDSNISTEIVTDATVVAKYNGNVYNLGYLLENGTLEHAIPNAWGRGYTYGYVDSRGIRHKGTMDKDWHPGFRPFPHFIPALLFNREIYNKEIGRVLDKEFK